MSSEQSATTQCQEPAHDPPGLLQPVPANTADAAAAAAAEPTNAAAAPGSAANEKPSSEQATAAPVPAAPSPTQQLAQEAAPAAPIPSHSEPEQTQPASAQAERQQQQTTQASKQVIDHANPPLGDALHEWFAAEDNMDDEIQRAKDHPLFQEYLDSLGEDVPEDWKFGHPTESEPFDDLEHFLFWVANKLKSAPLEQTLPQLQLQQAHQAPQQLQPPMEMEAVAEQLQQPDPEADPPHPAQAAAVTAVVMAATEDPPAAPALDQPMPAVSEDPPALDEPSVPPKIPKVMEAEVAAEDPVPKVMEAEVAAEDPVPKVMEAEVAAEDPVPKVMEQKSRQKTLPLSLNLAHNVSGWYCLGQHCRWTLTQRRWKST